MKIISCGTDHFEELVSFVVRLNGDDAHHIGFFGEGEADVRSSLAECVIPPAEGFQLAYDGDQLVGVFGVDADPEIGRAWLFGPLIEHADWQSLADELYAASMKIISDGISEQDLFCDIQNLNVAAFAERHGFPLRSENAVVTLERMDYKKLAYPTKARSLSLIIPLNFLTSSRVVIICFFQPLILRRVRSLRNWTPPAACSSDLKMEK